MIGARKLIRKPLVRIAIFLAIIFILALNYPPIYMRLFYNWLDYDWSHPEASLEFRLPVDYRVEFYATQIAAGERPIEVYVVSVSGEARLQLIAEDMSNTLLEDEDNPIVLDSPTGLQKEKVLELGGCIGYTIQDLEEVYGEKGTVFFGDDLARSCQISNKVIYVNAYAPGFSEVILKGT